MDSALSKLSSSNDLEGPGEVAPGDARAQEAPIDSYCRCLGKVANTFFADLATCVGALSAGPPSSPREQQRVVQIALFALSKVYHALLSSLRDLNADRNRQLTERLHKLACNEDLAPLMASSRVAELYTRSGPVLESLRAGPTPYEKSMALKDATTAIVRCLTRSSLRGRERRPAPPRMVLSFTVAQCQDPCTHAAFMERFIDVCDGDSLKGD